MSQLPTILGSLSALIVISISLLSGVNALTGTIRAGAAFAIFAAFGLILRYLLGDTPHDKTSNAAKDDVSLPPGVSVEEALSQENKE